jgi:hypothetical protein
MFSLSLQKGPVFAFQAMFADDSSVVCGAGWIM